MPIKGVIAANAQTITSLNNKVKVLAFSNNELNANVEFLEETVTLLEASLVRREYINKRLRKQVRES